jgi:FtsH-binding integral membrane protein
MIITRLGVDDYIIAAIELYLDVINMFLFVLQLLVLCGGRR